MNDSQNEVWMETPPTRAGVYDHWSPESGYTTGVRITETAAGVDAHAYRGGRWRRTGDLPGEEGAR